MFGSVSRKKHSATNARTQSQANGGNGGCFMNDGTDIFESIPNAETIEAFEEADAIKKDPSLAKGYTDVDEMFRELLS